MVGKNMATNATIRTQSRPAPNQSFGFGILRDLFELTYLCYFESSRVSLACMCILSTHRIAKVVGRINKPLDEIKDCLNCSGDTHSLAHHEGSYITGEAVNREAFSLLYRSTIRSKRYQTTMTTPKFFSFVVAVLLVLQCCSCVAFDAHAPPNQLRSGTGIASSSIASDRRRTEIDTFSLDGFLEKEEEDGDDDNEDDVNTIVDNADATEKAVDEIVDLLQRNAPQRDTRDETREPLDEPTGIPETDEPTPSPTSPVYTDAPTPVPTNDPMPAEPTEDPTSVPTNELTGFRYEEGVGGAGYEDGSKAPTSLPSLIPPTMSPTITRAETESSNNPTSLLSRAAGQTNSSAVVTNSSALTDEPTTKSPTNMPTASPTTSSPTPNPSSSPTTTSPTFSPTPACHDKRTYRSPINGLGCEQHVGSDCEQWHHIGLTKEQVVELHNECPVACGTDCE